VVEATRIAVVRPDSGPAQSAQGLPSSVTFGGDDGAGEQLLLGFPRSWTDLDVGAAFLLLTPASGAGPSGADVQVEVTLVGSAWTPGTLRRAPDAEGSASPGLARMRPPSVLRVDVTELLRQLAAQSRGRDEANDRGLLVRARRASERGATYLTGATGGTPRLDVYGHPRVAPTPE
jgi:hypothetical protein